MSVFLGIDFGCGACRTVVVREGVPEVVRNRFDERGLPHVRPVLHPKVMEAEVQNGCFPLNSTSLKQELGSLQFVDTVAGRHGVADKIAEILSQVREDVLGAINEPISGTVLGIPGFYTDCPRAALREAAQSAGFSAVRLADEGLAAVLGAENPMERGTALVFAFGAGVFSTSVVSVENGRGRVMSAEGNRLLGGNYLDRTLASLILKRLGRGEDFQNPSEASRYLLDLAREVKEGLSRREESLFDINLAKLFKSGDLIPLSVTRGEFEGLIAESVSKTIDLARKGLDAAGVPVSSLDRIVMVGGSTAIPYVESSLAKEFGIPSVRAGRIDIARGAALFGGRLGAAEWKRREAAAGEAEEPEPVQSPAPVQLPVRREPEQGTWVAKFVPYLTEAETRWKGGDRKGSIRTFEGLLKEMDRYLGTLYHSEAQGFLSDGNFDEAVDFLAKAAKLAGDPNDRNQYVNEYHRALNRRGAQLLAAGRLEEARLILRKALDINPKCPSCMDLYDRARRGLRISVPGKAGKKRK
jgi:actin-like ATPase involved in cell morphogenesis